MPKFKRNYELKQLNYNKSILESTTMQASQKITNLRIF